MYSFVQSANTDHVLSDPRNLGSHKEIETLEVGEGIVMKVNM